MGDYSDEVERHRSIPSEMFLGKCIMKLYSKFTGEHLCRSVT